MSKYFLIILYIGALFIQSYFKRVYAIDCFKCDAQKNWECNTLESVSNRTKYIEHCRSSTCQVLVGQWGNIAPYENFALQRGCTPMERCREKSASCCLCNTHLCNINNNPCGIGYNSTRSIKFVANFWYLILSSVLRPIFD